MPPHIIRSPDLRDQVFEVLKNRILAGEFDQSTKFQEINLAEELSVSRTPAREALAMLVRDGLLVAKGRGFGLPLFTADEIRDIIEVRLQLEPFAIRRIIESNDASQTTELAEFIKKTLSATSGDITYAKAHQVVREKIYSHIPNQALVKALRRFEDSINYLRLNTLQSQQTRMISYQGMLDLADSIAARDTTMASALMTQQLINARAALIEEVSST